MSSPETFRVVVLGGNYAGLSISHHLLREVLPSLSSNPAFSYKLTLVTPNTHAMWKVGIPRTLISDEIKPLDDLFLPIEEHFTQYGKAKFELVQGVAVGLDHGRKVVRVMRNVSTTEENVEYDALVVATGTTTKSALWTFQGDHLKTHAAITDIRASLETAKTIVIGGAGPTGVETAGEIGTYLPGKKVKLLSGCERVLPRLPAPVAEAAAKKLRKLNVVVQDGIKVTDTKEISTNGKKQTHITYSNGTQETVDLYIDSTGGSYNTSFLPQEWLTSTGQVNSIESTQRVDGVRGVYAMGDIAAPSRRGVFDSTFPKKALGYSLWEDFRSANAPSAVQEVRYTKHLPNTWLVPVGPHGGVGVVKGWQTPSLFIWWMKCRTFFFEQFRPLVEGNGH